MLLSEVFPSKYVKADDIPEGKKVPVVIDRCKQEEVGREKDLRLVLYFKGSNKGFVVNKTNGTAIGDAYGRDTDLWIGKPILLYRTTTSFAGDTLPCIRVSIPPAGAPAPAPAPAATPQSSETAAPPFGDDVVFDPKSIPF